MLIFVVLCIALAGVFGDEDESCDFFTMYDECRHHLPFEELEAIQGVPNEEELLRVCPGQLKYAECYFDNSKNCEEEGSTYIALERRQFEILKDICDEDTPLHKNFVASAECYKTLVDEANECYASARSIYHKYREYLEKEHPQGLEDSDESDRQRRCMVESYKIGCLYKKVQNTCSYIATSVLLELVDRSMYLSEFCSGTFIDELQTTFLESLSLDEDEKAIFATVFNLI